ncbi:MAG: hypothetical protein HW380_4005, partial [Magnetococcales bacterium]|nr:hypothetical protein [Magnetococcales bacterium]
GTPAHAQSDPAPWRHDGRIGGGRGGTGEAALILRECQRLGLRFLIIKR